MANKKENSSRGRRGWFGDSERHRAAGRQGGRRRHKRNTESSQERNE